MNTLQLLCSAATLLCATAIAQAPGAHWSVTTTTGAAPSQRRENPGTASDTKMYAFGGALGNATSTVVNELWEFDGNAWTMKTANGAPGAPPARSQAGVTWDSTRDRLIVFGGNGTAGTLGDTWEWDPNTNTWTDVTPPAPAVSPSARRFCSIAHDPVTGGILLFGGLDAGGTHLNDTWLFFGGSTWVQLNLPGPQPDVRRQHHLVERPDLADVILCGGQDATLPAPAKWRVDTWRWDGTNWLQIPTANTPAAVVANDAAYDPIRQRVVLVGGNSVAGVQPTGEISEFDALTNDWVTRWTVSGDPTISRISRQFMAYVPALGRIYKIGGQTPAGGASATTTCEYQSDVVADFVSTSPGCASTAGVPELRAVRMPWLGRDLVMEVGNVPAGASSFLLIGLNTTSIPLSTIGIGAASCVVTVDPILGVAIPTSVTTGRPTLAIPVPVDVALVSGPAMLNQAVIVDPAAAVSMMVSVSNRGEAVFGAL